MAAAKPRKSRARPAVAVAEQPPPAAPTHVFEMVSVAELAKMKWAGNPREISAEEFDALKRSLATFGVVEPVVVNRRSGRVVGGHQRIDAMVAIGITECPVSYVDLDDEAEVVLNIALNKIGAKFKWDLMTPLLQAMGQADRALTGFRDDEVQRLLKDGHLFGLQAEEARDALRAYVASGAPQDPEPPPPPEPPEHPTSRRGDLWILGEHRLLCGDSTLDADVSLVMDGARAGLMNTDPPYGISFDNAALGPTRRDYDAIANDDLTDGKLQAFLELVFKAASKHALSENAAWYLWHAHLTQGFFAAAAAQAADVVLHRQIIWVKPRLVLGRGQYHWRHEPCFMGWVKGKSPPDYGKGAGERDQTTVWELDGVPVDERREFGHATPKPVALFEIPIVKHLRAGEVCFEPFAGSGPQLLAAQKHGRRCCAIELNPGYVDVIVQRWQAFSGGKAFLHGTEQSFEQVATERGVAS